MKERITAAGRDIYDARDVNRQLLVLAADLRPGDSGGPVINNEGLVVGMAIAVAPDRKSTAYAIDATAETIRPIDPPGRCIF
jgi:S1-C subfamily serine protease